MNFRDLAGDCVWRVGRYVSLQRLFLASFSRCTRLSSRSLLLCLCRLLLRVDSTILLILAIVLNLNACSLSCKALCLVLLLQHPGTGEEVLRNVLLHQQFHNAQVATKCSPVEACVSVLVGLIEKS